MCSLKVNHIVNRSATVLTTLENAGCMLANRILSANRCQKIDLFYVHHEQLIASAFFMQAAAASVVRKHQITTSDVGYLLFMKTIDCYLTTV